MVFYGICMMIRTVGTPKGCSDSFVGGSNLAWKVKCANTVDAAVTLLLELLMVSRTVRITEVAVYSSNRGHSPIRR